MYLSECEHQEAPADPDSRVGESITWVLVPEKVGQGDWMGRQVS